MLELTWPARSHFLVFWELEIGVLADENSQAEVHEHGPTM
jgi:hypothetical protein